MWSLVASSSNAVAPPVDWLFTGLSDNIKYKFKNFVDTVIYRGGDVFTQFFLISYLITDTDSVLHHLEQTMNFDWPDNTVLILLGLVFSVAFIWNAYRAGKLAIQTFAEQKANPTAT